MQLIDWTTLYENYKGLWVALSDADNETVVGSGETAKEALDQAHRNGFSKAAITYVSEGDYPALDTTECQSLPSMACKSDRSLPFRCSCLI
jgi:uncharacterized protein DUF5678